MDKSASVIQHMLKMIQSQTEKHGWPRAVNTPRFPKISKSQGQGIQ